MRNYCLWIRQTCVLAALEWIESITGPVWHDMFITTAVQQKELSVRHGNDPKGRIPHRAEAGSQEESPAVRARKGADRCRTGTLVGDDEFEV